MVGIWAGYWKSCELFVLQTLELKAITLYSGQEVRKSRKQAELSMSYFSSSYYRFWVYFLSLSFVFFCFFMGGNVHINYLISTSCHIVKIFVNIFLLVHLFCCKSEFQKIIKVICLVQLLLFVNTLLNTLLNGSSSKKLRVQKRRTHLKETDHYF